MSVKNASCQIQGNNKKTQDIYRPTICRISTTEELTPTERLFRVEPNDGFLFDHKPGQFMQVSVFGIGEAPISISSSSTRGKFLDLAVRKAGILTGMMHTFKTGDTIGMRGPFGTFFDIDSFKGKHLLLIAGGCGLAPMRSLIQYVEDRRSDFGDIKILYGAKSPLDVLYKEELSIWRHSQNLTCEVTVDNVLTGTCWDGHVGLIPSLIRRLKVKPQRTEAVIIGPPAMYRFVIKELHDKGLTDENITISLERHMKCGNGKCGHCAIGHYYCCLDGPVFQLSQLRDLDIYI
jgi:sulfhydrogenase subunit gamma (sulfur reductase)